MSLDVSGRPVGVGVEGTSDDCASTIVRIGDADAAVGVGVGVGGAGAGGADAAVRGGGPLLPSGADPRFLNGRIVNDRRFCRMAVTSAEGAVAVVGWSDRAV